MRARWMRRRCSRLRDISTPELEASFRELDTLENATGAYKLLVLSVLDERDVGREDGTLDTIGWVTWAARVTKGRARALVETARALAGPAGDQHRRTRGPTLRGAARRGRAGRDAGDGCRVGGRLAGLDRDVAARRGAQPEDRDRDEAVERDRQPEARVSLG